MSAVAGDTVLHLQPDVFPASGERLIAESGAFSVTSFRYPSSVEGLRIANARGHVVVLPFLGQMIWDAVFDGRRLTMGNVFPYPRNGASILETYGAFAYHAGVLRNGTPGPQDTHPLHGEMPVTRMDSAHLRVSARTTWPAPACGSMRTAVCSTSRWWLKTAPRTRWS
jgi:monosaccharide-transporting ATPase